MFPTCSCSAALLSVTIPHLRRRIMQQNLQRALPFHHSSSSFNSEWPKERKAFKTTELLNKNRRGKLEPIGPKKIESRKPTVHIFDGISLRQLAIAVDSDLNTMMDCVLELANERVAERCLDNVDAPLDRVLLLDIVSFLNMRPVMTTPPKVEHIDESAMDLHPQPPPQQSELSNRAPIVTIMGHVDHGKTTLLDALRRSNIVAQEFGGITQHIGAFSVKLPDIGNVTFLDTPGHSAFKAMRERGARATDIVVLVVAADDSVMEQTVESIRYAREAGVPIIVAINKCDKPGINTENVLHDLLHHGIVPEQFGGDTLVVHISALHGQGIDKLQEAILLQAEMMNLQSTAEGPVEATIIESSNVQGLGNVCTLIVNRGTLRRGTVLVAGTSWGRVRTMHNEFNAQVQEAGPSSPVRISGWRNQLPAPGEIALEAPNEQKAQSVVEFRTKKKQERKSIKEMEMIEKKRLMARQKYQEKRLEQFKQGIRAKKSHDTISYTTISEEGVKEATGKGVPKLPIILKCDVDGTKQAVQDVLATYDTNDQVQLEVVESDVGPLNERDLELAADTGAHIMAFNSSVNYRIQELAKQKNVPLEQFHVIYKLVERLKELLNAQLTPLTERRLLGAGTVIHEYRLADGAKKRQPVAGIRVDWGTMERSGTWRFVRSAGIGAGAEQAENKDPSIPDQSSAQEIANKPAAPSVIYEGSIESMQHQKKPVNKATIDMEIGVAVNDKNIRYKEDDQVEVYEDVVVPQEIRWNPPGF